MVVYPSHTSIPFHPRSYEPDKDKLFFLSAIYYIIFFILYSILPPTLYHDVLDIPTHHCSLDILDDCLVISDITFQTFQDNLLVHFHLMGGTDSFLVIIIIPYKQRKEKRVTCRKYDEYPYRPFRIDNKHINIMMDILQKTIQTTQLIITWNISDRFRYSSVLSNFFSGSFRLSRIPLRISCSCLLLRRIRL